MPKQIFTCRTVGQRVAFGTVIGDVQWQRRESCRCQKGLGRFGVLVGLYVLIKTGILSRPAGWDCATIQDSSRVRWIRLPAEASSESRKTDSGVSIGTKVALRQIRTLERLKLPHLYRSKSHHGSDISPIARRIILDSKQIHVLSLVPPGTNPAGY